MSQSGDYTVPGLGLGTWPITQFARFSGIDVIVQVPTVLGKSNSCYIVNIRAVAYVISIRLETRSFVARRPPVFPQCRLSLVHILYISLATGLAVLHSETNNRQRRDKLSVRGTYTNEKLNGYARNGSPVQLGFPVRIGFPVRTVFFCLSEPVFSIRTGSRLY